MGEQRATAGRNGQLQQLSATKAGDVYNLPSYSASLVVACFGNSTSTTSSSSSSLTRLPSPHSPVADYTLVPTSLGHQPVSRALDRDFLGSPGSPAAVGAWLDSARLIRASGGGEQ